MPGEDDTWRLYTRTVSQVSLSFVYQQSNGEDVWRVDGCTALSKTADWRITPLVWPRRGPANGGNQTNQTVMAVGTAWIGICQTGVLVDEGMRQGSLWLICCLGSSQFVGIVGLGKAAYHISSASSCNRHNLKHRQPLYTRDSQPIHIGFPSISIGPSATSFLAFLSNQLDNLSSGQLFSGLLSGSARG